jgi:hypothetical protein
VRPRLYLDEDVTRELAGILRTRGFDVVSAHEVGAVALPDEEQLLRATTDGRALLTFNYVDFLQIAKEWLIAGRRHAGIIVSYRQYSRHQLGVLVAAVQALLNTLSAENLDNSILVRDPFRAG